MGRPGPAASPTASTATPDNGGGNGVVGFNGANDLNTGGAGVLGTTVGSSSVGVRAKNTVGVALDVQGPAKFSRSGRLNVAANKAYVDVTVPGGFGANSSALATLQTYRSGV